VVTRLPRLVVAAPATGQGKTTIATGLMAALTRAGHVVSGHKVGPDYIDPGYHALASGRPGRNLDPHLVGEDRIVPLLLHGARGADVAVVEGVMGLYDGRIGTQGYASTAHVATLTRTPVVLVVDISRASRSVGAVVHGMATFSPDVEIAAVVLNKAGSPRHAAEVADSIDLPVLGVLGRDQAISAPSRHLGLVPAAERAEAAHALDALADLVADAIDLEAVLELAATAPHLDEQPWDPAEEVSAPSDRRPVVAMAGGRAFTFRYAETEELLRAAGCRVETFDPLLDASLPEGTSGIYLGGGFPEVHAPGLSENAPLRAELHAAIAAGVPTVAECAGLLYLCQSVDDALMVGSLPATARMTPRLTLSYPSVTAPADSLLTRVGETVTGHEFHRTSVDPAAGSTPAWSIDGTPVGFAGPSLHASYLHVHWAGHPQVAQRFADAVHATSARGGRAASEASDQSGPPASVSRPLDLTDPVEPLTDPLRHHGDAEVRDAAVVDFAVNVHPGPRPLWLDQALRDSLDHVGGYPSPDAAEEAVARRHGVDREQVLATAGAAEAFTLVARARAWRRPAVVHPQFTEPHAALVQAGHAVAEVLLPPPFVLDPAAVPDDADLVVLGNPTNPTGVLHPAATVRGVVRPGRLVVVDEAFIDTVPGEGETVLGTPGVLVIRSLTKHWSIPGIRAGYAVGPADVIADLRREQSPWSLSTTAAAAIRACTSDAARAESGRRAEVIAGWRDEFVAALLDLEVPVVTSSTSFVLARLGAGGHAALRGAGIAVRRADTFPGLDGTWVRIAVRPPEQQRQLLVAVKSWRDALSAEAPDGLG
jgi:cobyrinic acid a,c-diamide synthase